MLYVGMDGMGWDGMVVIGHRFSKSTFGANNTKYKLEVQKGMGNMMTVNEKALKFFGKFNFVEMCNFTKTKTKCHLKISERMPTTFIS